MSERERPPTNARDDAEAERHGARAAVYGTLAGAFLYPDDATVAELTAPETAEGLRSGAERLGLADEAATLVDALDGVDADRLRRAYDRLFGLPGEDGTYPVVPYEAHYTVGDEVGLEQRRVATVAGLIEAFELEASDDFHERHDHVAVELELMQVLAARRGLAAEAGDPGKVAELGRMEATVLDAHLVDFVPAFAHDLRAATEEPVYRAAADLAAELVRLDHAAHPDPGVTAPTGGEPR